MKDVIKSILLLVGLIAEAFFWEKVSPLLRYLPKKIFDRVISRILDRAAYIYLTLNALEKSTLNLKK